MEVSGKDNDIQHEFHEFYLFPTCSQDTHTHTKQTSDLIHVFNLLKVRFFVGYLHVGQEIAMVTGKYS